MSRIKIRERAAYVALLEERPVEAITATMHFFFFFFALFSRWPLSSPTSTTHPFPCSATETTFALSLFPCCNRVHTEPYQVKTQIYAHRDCASSSNFSYCTTPRKCVCVTVVLNTGMAYLIEIFDRRRRRRLVNMSAILAVPRRLAGPFTRRLAPPVIQNNARRRRIRRCPSRVEKCWRGT